MNLSIFNVDELVALARLDLEARHLDKCLEKIKTALAIAPDNINAIGLGARIYAQLKLFTPAIDLYKQFLEQVPSAVTECFQYGMVHLESGNPESAIEIWSQVLEVTPTHPPALFYSGIAFLELNQKEDAQRCFDILIKSAPIDNLYFGRAKEVLQQLNSGQFTSPSKSDEVYQ